MIVWSGRGFLSVIGLIASFVLFASILPKEQGDYGFILSFFITGVFSWFMGKKWNQVTTDPESGEVLYQPNHSLFWIKMQYWGPIFAIMGIIILVQQFI